MFMHYAHNEISIFFFDLRPQITRHFMQRQSRVRF